MAVENAYFLELLQWQRSILAAGLDVILAAGCGWINPSTAFFLGCPLGSQAARRMT